MDKEQNPFPEMKVVDPRAYLAPRIKKAGDAISSLFHFLPPEPLAPHGDHLPSELKELDISQP